MVEISLIISLLSAGFAIFSGITNMKRNKATDDKKDAAEITTVIVKLENISNDIRDIKNELRSVRAEVGGLRERVIVTEQTAKSLHQRVDTYEDRLRRVEELILKEQC